MLTIFLKGLLIGLAIAAPVGPIGMLCIHRSLYYGFVSGFSTGLGAAFADGTYGAIAGFGLTSISGYLIHYRYPIQFFGGAFLLYLAIRIISCPLKETTYGNRKNFSAVHNFLTTFMLTLSNPMTILSFLGVFAGIGVGTKHVTSMSSIFIVLGVILGSALWWLFLSTIVSWVIKSKLNEPTMRFIHAISSLIIAGFGAVAIILCFV